MGDKGQLIKQVRKVIVILEQKYPDDIEKGVIGLLYKRYKDALFILENDRDIAGINIVGGVRAYMDSYNDYMNPLLKELYEAEKMLV